MLTPYNVAQKIYKGIHKESPDTLKSVWSKEKTLEWTGTCELPAVVWEEGPYEWAIEPEQWMMHLAEANGCYLEAYNGFILLVVKGS